MENRFVRGIFKNIPAVYLVLAFTVGITGIFTVATTVKEQNFNVFAVVMGAALLQAFLLTLCKLIEGISAEKTLQTICFSLIVLFAVGLSLSCYFLREEPQSDMLYLHQTALNYVETGKWSHFLYFSLYPFQKNWLYVITLFYKIEYVLGINDYRTLPLAFNVIMMVFCAVFACKITEKLIGLKASVIVLLFIVLTPWNYSYVAYYYTLVPGMFFTLLVIYLSLFDKWYMKLIMGVIAAVGYEMRATVGIAFVAVTLYALFKHEKGFVKEIIISLVGFGTLVVLWSCLSSKLGFAVTDLPFAPTHWVVLGTTGKGVFNKNIYYFDRTFESKGQMMTEDIKYIFDYYREKGIKAVFSLWIYKFQNFFGFATMNSYKDAVTDENKLFVYSLGSKRLFADYFAQTVRAVTLFNALIASVKIFREKMNKLYPVFIFVFGYVLFYTFWESGSRYCFPCFFAVQILAVFGILKFDDKLSAKIPKTKKAFASYAALCAAVLIAFESLFVVNLDSLTVEKSKTIYTSASNVYHSMNINFSIYDDVNIELKEGEALCETFNAFRGFTTVQLVVPEHGKKDKSIYLFELLDENGNVVREKEFRAKDVKKDRITISFDETEVKSKKEFTIRVSVKEKAEGSSAIKIRGNVISDGVRRSYFNGYADGYGLNQVYFKAYKKVTEPMYSKAVVFAVMAAVLLFGLVPIVYLLKRMKRCETASTT